MTKDRLKVILAYPNFKWWNWEVRTAWNVYPYNLALLAAMIKDKHDVRIIDANMDNLSQEEFSKIISEEKPDVLGISVLTMEYGKAGSIACKLAKEANPEIITIMGGVNVISAPEQTIKDLYLDYAVNGEGEIILRDLCEYFAGRGEIPKKGILYKENGKIINLGRADVIMNLDDLPYPAYDLMDIMKYATKGQREQAGQIGSPRAFPHARVITSRGCPNKCCFCQVHAITGRRVRYRSVKHILGELDILKEKYGIKFIYFDDDNMLANKDFAKKLFSAMIEKKYDFLWNGNSFAVFWMDDELIDIMKKSGCVQISISIESAVPRVYENLIHKPVNIEHSKKMVKKIKQAGIDIEANFMVGVPGETWDEIRENIRISEEMDFDYVKFNIATPLPNTELYKMALENNYLIDGFSFDKYIWAQGWLKTPEFDPDSLMILRAFEWDRVNFTKPEKRKKIAEMMHITEEKLNEIRRNTMQSALNYLKNPEKNE